MADSADGQSDLQWEKVDETRRIRVLQWNILAESLAKNDGQGFPFVPAEALDNVRRSVIRDVIISKANADLIALQEVDNPELLEEFLKEEGYDVVYNRRSDSPLGVLMAWKSKDFTLVGKHLFTFHTEGQVATILRLKKGDLNIVFATTHLKAKHDGVQKRDKQAEELALMVQSVHSKHGGAIIVAGDFNDCPDSYAVQRLVADPLHLQSAYGLEPTTFKVRVSEWPFYDARSTEEDRTDPHAAGVKRDTQIATEDYILHNGRTLERLPLPTEVEFPMLPTKDHPSDHLCLCADLGF